MSKRKKVRRKKQHPSPTASQPQKPASAGSNLADLLQQGVALHQKGMLEQAGAIYDSLLAHKPDHPDLLHLKGVLSHQMGQHEAAVSLIRRAIKHNGKNPVFFYNLGISLKGCRRLEEAVDAYLTALSFQPRNPEILFNLGNVYREKQDITKALQAYRQAYELSPNDLKILYNLGNTLKENGDLEGALQQYHEILRVNPGEARAQYNIGTVYQIQNRHRDAFEAYQKTLELDPENVRAFNNLGNLFQTRGELRSALAQYEKAVKADPEYTIARFNLGNVYHALDDLKKAVECYDEAIQMGFDAPDIFINRGLACRSMGQLERGAQSFREALNRYPDHYRALSSLVHQLQYMCEWEELEELAPRLDAITEKAIQEGGDICESPFETVTRHEEPARNFPVARHWALDVEKSAASDGQVSGYDFSDRRDPRERPLIIGYLSHDFCNHPVSHLILSLLRLHDRRHFHINCYSYGRDDGSYYRREVANRCDRFVDVRNMSFREAADQIYQDKVDILVDLMGFTRNNRLGICAHRPAPVQVTYLGFPGTTGARFMDYILVDRVIAPPEHAPYYSEKFVYLPHTYMVTDRGQPISSRRFERSEVGLPEDGFVFCSFNQSYKIEPVMFSVWMELLRELESAVLWLPKRNDPVISNLKKAAEKRGVTGDRLIFSDRVPSKPDFLSRLRLADLALDTRIYNGHATSIDALWAGVPVITRKGGHFASRAAASFLQALGLPELVTEDVESYRERALFLAQNPDKLLEIRRKLEKNRFSESLFDSPRFTRNLESSYQMMWKRYEAREQPDVIEVPDCSDDAAVDGIETWEIPEIDDVVYHQAELPSAVLHLDPGRPTGFFADEFQRVVQLHQSGQLEAAKKSYQKILASMPDHALCLHLLGVLHHQQGDGQTALELISRAIELKPESPDFYSNQGVVLLHLGRMPEAVQSFQKALSLKPESPDALNNMGPALKALGRVDEAIDNYRKALDLKPNYPEAYNNLGNALQSRGRAQEAVESFQKSIELRPTYAEAHYNLGNSLQTVGRLEDAIRSFEKALEVNPEYHKAFVILYYRLRYICDWGRVDDMARQLDALTRSELEEGKKTNETPFINLTRAMDPELNLQVAESWGREISRAAARTSRDFSMKDRQRNKEKLVIGYLSNDFFDHPVAHQISALFSLHDRDRFEVRGYSYGPDDGSAYRAHIARNCDRFVDVRSLSHEEAAARIYEDGVDILVELMGHTKDNRLDICAFRPAPIQVTYLGYPGTTGTDFLDYIITDRWVTPPEHQKFFSERFVYMPHCYMVNDHTQAIAARPWGRKTFGLPPAGVVFASFNQPYKIEPATFDVWMRILREVPGSVLWMSKKVKSGQDNLRKEAEKRNVDPARLIFADRLKHKADHLARLQLADLVLDTRVYNGHATTNDALWSGVPVVTVTGTHYASRAAGSFLNAIGLPELITEDWDQYAELAISLGNDPEAIARLKEKLWKNRRVMPLFDTPRFVRNLEEGFEEMWARFVAGKAPRPIEIQEKAFQTSAGRSLSIGRPPANRPTPSSPPAPKKGPDLSIGVRHHQAGQLEQAETVYREALKQYPDHADALHLLGVVLHQKGRHAEAIQFMNRAVKKGASSPSVYSNLGSAKHALGRFEQAVFCYDSALSKSPDFAEAHYNKGLALKQLGRASEAVASFEKTLELRPEHAEAAFNLGIVLQEIGRTQEAIAAYQRSLEYRPRYAKVYNNLAILHQGNGNRNEAIANYQKAVEIDPEYAEALFNMGNVFKEQGNGEKALECYTEAARKKPERAEFYLGIGNVYKDNDRYDLAAEQYRKALSLNPDFSEAESSLFHCLQQLCDWSELPSLSKRLDAAIDKAISEGRPTTEVPFVHLTRCDDPARNLDVARSWVNAVQKNIRGINTEFDFSHRPRNPERLVIGYLSHDFCNHPVAHQIGGLFALHDRLSFEVNAYSYGPDDKSVYRRRIMENCDRFVDISTMTHEAAARRIYEDGVDILVDLTGHTRGKRLEICALRPAPVQMTYLGFPGTLGGDFIDFIIVDRTVVPEAEQQFYTEKLAYMPHSFMVTDPTQTISPNKWTKTDLGINEDAFVFCSLNKAYKIEPVMFDVWMRILRDVPGSVLLLRAIGDVGENNLRKEAKNRAVEPDRLIFLEKLPQKKDYLARLQVADLCLDTRLYNGHATTCDALWAGVPVITLEGRHFPSRVGSSLLREIGFQELVVDSLNAYHKLALDIAKNSGTIKKLKNELKEKRVNSSLFNQLLFARNMDDMFKRVKGIYLE